MSDNALRFVKDALAYWAGSYPRRVQKYQRWSTSVEEAATLALEAEDEPDNWPFVSTYSFPHGHPKDDNVPRIDRLFIDMDVPEDGEYRSGNQARDAWVRDMSKLLVRTRKVARFLLKTKHPEAWQVALSGSKGIHIDLVFPPISPANGDYSQFENGIVSYANSIKEYLIDHTEMDDLEEYIDVSSENLSQMRRVPNTKHLGATQTFGEDRFCVPVTLEELATMRPADYIELTRERREVDDRFKPIPNPKAGEVLTQRVKTASSTSRNVGGGGATKDPARIKAYVACQNNRIGVDDLDFVLTDRPCVAAFFGRNDAFQHGSSSHNMEMFAITHMMDKDVPIEIEIKTDENGRDRDETIRVVGGTMVEAFRGLPGFDKSYTCERIETYISLGYAPVKCETLWKKAPAFCLEDGTSTERGCQIWVDQHRQTNARQP